MDGPDDGGGVHVKAIFRRNVTDLISNFPRNPGDIEERLRRNLAADVYQPHGDVCLARHARLGIVPQAFVQHRVRYLVAELVRMPFGHRLRGEKHVLRIH
jgi:hypothetical protein